MQTQKGFRYEKELTNELDRQTENSIGLYRCGWSGNSAMPQPDILITTPCENYALEVKDTSQDRFTIQSDDIDQLLKCAKKGTSTWITINFNNRELLVARLNWANAVGRENQRELLVDATPVCFNPRLGRTGTFIVDKPSTDEWPSKQAGRDDWQVIVDLFDLSYDGENE